MNDTHISERENESAKMYARMYYTLFNAVTEAIEQIKRGPDEEARRTLIRAQRETEEIYLDWKDDPESRDP